MASRVKRYTGTSIYESLAERLRVGIREGHYAPGQLIGSEHELSRRENISRMTVRKASEVLIAEGLLERRPGKGLYVKSCSKNSGVRTVQVVGNMLWPTSLEMARGVQSAVKDEKMHIQIYDAHGDVELDMALVESLPRTQAEGAVIIALHHPRFTEMICRLHMTRFPLVLLDQRMHDIEVSSVTSDNYRGGYLVGELLGRMGHVRVSFIGDLMAATVRDRINGFRDGLAEFGIALKKEQVMDLDVGIDRFGDWSEKISAGVKRLFDKKPYPTAIFCSCDAVARQVYRDMDGLGLRIPQDVSVIGCDDDSNIVDYLHPGLTTIRQSFGDLGRTAMELLKRRIQSPESPVESLILPVELVMRESVGPPRKEQDS
jgi:DNA-binding LacI/PurR family transcriptional regulator